jgi:hypothetical protein
VLIQICNQIFPQTQTFWRPIEFKPYSERKQMTCGHILIYVIPGKIEINLFCLFSLLRVESSFNGICSSSGQFDAGRIHMCVSCSRWIIHGLMSSNKV